MFWTVIAFFLLLSSSLGEKEKDPPLAISREVADALRNGLPVVALESTIISHGMPFPRNLETARAVESVVREAGATPATVAIVAGVARIGIGADDMERLARGSGSVPKVSRRDIAAVIASGGDGATTVSATALLASMAGIRVFVTGGIGGVHRGAEESMDVSADLTELGRTPICVVSAGVKSLLDIGRTLEFLETQGVTVVALGADEFPAFFTRKSGFLAPMRLNTSEQCAALIAANGRLKLGSGILVAVPIPAEEEADGEVVENAIRKALAESKENAITGREVTPFILKRVSELTGGASLDSNIALVKNNARVGASIAVALSKLLHPAPATTGRHKVVVFGGAIIDLISKATVKLLPRTTSVGTVTIGWGGVGRNIAEALARLGSVDPLMVTALATDSFGEMSLAHLRELGMSTDGIVSVSPASNLCVSETCGSARRTALCSAIMDENGEQQLGICDTSIIDEVTPDVASAHEADIAAAKIVVVDGNLLAETILRVAGLCEKHGVPLLFEPTSVTKSLKAVGALSRIQIITPNRDEAAAMSNALPEELKAGLDLSDVRDQCRALLRAGVHTVILKLGSQGGVVAERTSSGEPRFTPFSPPKPRSIVNVVGAGDSLVSGTIWGIVAKGLGVVESIPFGTQAARLSLESVEPISPRLTAETIVQQS